MTNVFHREGEGVEGIRHRWGTEMLCVPSHEGGDPRHMDLVWSLWQVLDMTPGGRGAWYPSLDYGGAE